MLVADGKHILTDVYTSGGVFVGLILVYLTGKLLMLDGVVACMVGINIVITGVKLVREAYGGLMDTSDPLLLDEISSRCSPESQGHLDRRSQAQGLEVRKARSCGFPSDSATRYAAGGRAS